MIVYELGIFHIYFGATPLWDFYFVLTTGAIGKKPEFVYFEPRYF